MRRQVLTEFILTAAIAFCLAGCIGQEPVTMDLEEIQNEPYPAAVAQAMENYQIIGTKKYLYPGLPEWLDAGRTASIYKTEQGKIQVFTRSEAGSYEWRSVYYAYGFYDQELMQGNKADGDSPLMVSPVLLSADGEAVAYQTMGKNDYAIVVAVQGEPNVFLDGNGGISTDGPLSDENAGGQYDWTQFEYCWSSDGKTLFYYKMGISDGGASSMLLFPQGVYLYDRETGTAKLLCEAMKVKMPQLVSRYPTAESMVADVDCDQAALFLLFDDNSGCPDVLLWNRGGRLTVSYPSLPENPCVQLRLEEGMYYYQANGEIRRARLGSTDASERVLYTDGGLKTFLVSKDEKKVFTIEKEGDREDICLYLCDETQSGYKSSNWYKQVLYTQAEGAVSLQLSEDELTLLVECRDEHDSMALLMNFYEKAE